MNAVTRNRAFRFAAWLLPPHRKEWAEAMLNESCHIDSRRVALRWVLGCTLAALRERLGYELRRTLMSRRIFRVALGLGAVLALAAAGIYVSSKPYQRERIWITVRHSFSPDHPQRTE